jgi:hypothetical protein
MSKPHLKPAIFDIDGTDGTLRRVHDPWAQKLLA